MTISTTEGGALVQGKGATMAELDSSGTSGLDQARVNASEVAAAVVEALREVAKEKVDG